MAAGLTFRNEPDGIKCWTWAGGRPLQSLRACTGPKPKHGQLRVVLSNSVFDSGAEVGGPAGSSPAPAAEDAARHRRSVPEHALVADKQCSKQNK